jgi:hypothetical protein
MANTYFGLNWQNLQGCKSTSKKMFTGWYDMMGSGFGKIHIRFGDTLKRVINDGNVQNDH